MSHQSGLPPHDSSCPTGLAQVRARETGCDVRYLGIAKDNREDLRGKIIAGLDSDILLTSGGVSVGKYDLVLDVLREIGAEIKFWKVNIKPGMPLLFGMCRGKPVFGLPGNPVSAMITFQKFAKPALLKMMGHKTVETGIKIRAKLEHEIRKTDGKRHFMRGSYVHKNGAAVVRVTGSQSSNLLTSLSKANCLIIVPEEVESLQAGAEVEIELL